MSSVAWPRSRRLLESARFTACYEQGRKFYTRHFVLFVLGREDAGQGLRLGLTVSKKVGRAVQRNRVRRVLREFFRLNQGLIDQSVDIVVVPKRNLDPKTVDMALVEQEISPVIPRVEREFRVLPDERPPCAE